MRHNPNHAVSDESVVRTLIAENPWATIVSDRDGELVARVLRRLVAHFEQHVEHPLYLEDDVGARLAPGTVGIRLPITRFVCKVKMSQDKDPETQRRVLAELRGSGPYASPAVAAAMERALATEPQ